MASFGVKHFETITGSIVNFFTGNNSTLTGFQVGARLRTAFEAVAIELEQIYYQLYIGITDGIESGVYASFNFPLLQAAPASGSVRFSRLTPAPVGGITIPAGTQVSTEGSSTSPAVVYDTVDTVIIPAGQTYIDASVVASVDGTVGNAPSGSIKVLVGSPAGVDSVVNPATFFTGRDLETSDQRRDRFLKYISNLTRATVGALEYAAMTVDNVVDASALESPTLNVYIYDANLLTYTDISFEANLPSGAPIRTLPAAPHANDSLYIGLDSRFDLLRIELDLGMAGGVYQWEYYNGSAFVLLPLLSDSTSFMGQSGYLSFTKPSNWKSTIINGTSKFWIRLRVVAPTMSQVATLIQVKATPFPGVVHLVAMNAAGALPDLLRDDIIKAVDAYRGAGTQVLVTGPTLTLTDITLQVTAAPLADAVALQTLIQQNVTNFVASFTLNQKLVLSELIQYVENLSSDIKEVRVILPLDTIDSSFDEILRPGVITVTVQQ